MLLRLRLEMLLKGLTKTFDKRVTISVPESIPSNVTRRVAGSAPRLVARSDSRSVVTTLHCLFDIP